MIDTIKKTINFIFQSIAYFKKRLKETPAFLILLVFIFISQIIVGHYLNKSILFSLLFPIGNFIFSSIIATIVLFFTDPQKISLNIKRPVLQTIFILFAVTVVFFWLLGQFPNPAISNNILTQIISSIIRFLTSFWANRVSALFEPVGLNSDIIDNFSVGLHQLFVFVLFPSILLFPFLKKSNSFRIQWFNYRLMIFLLLIYIPFVFANENSLIFLFLYFITYLLIAFSEEYLFRFLLQSRLEAFLNNRLNSIALASLAFGIVHIPINSKIYGWPVSVAFCLGINTFGGILNGYIYSKTRSLLLATVVHAWSGTILM